MTTDNNQYAILPSSPADRQKILDAFQEISDAHIRKAAESTYIKDAFSMLHTEYKIPKKDLRELFSLWFNQNAQEKKDRTEEVIAAYEVLTGNTVD